MAPRKAKRIIPVLLLILVVGVAIFLVCPGMSGRSGRKKPAVAATSGPVAPRAPVSPSALPDTGKKTPTESKNVVARHPQKHHRGGKIGRPARHRPGKAHRHGAAPAKPALPPKAGPKVTPPISGLAPSTMRPTPAETTRAAIPAPAETTRAVKPVPPETTRTTRPAPVESTRVAVPTPAETTRITKPVPAETTGAMKPAPIETTRAIPPPAETSRTAELIPVPDCARDTAAPWAYSDPAGGLYYGPIAVYFHANKPCTVYWRFAPDTVWHEWKSDSISIKSTATLTYRAVDKCGRVMAERSESYDLRSAAGALECPKGMVPIENGQFHFCIDAYEWPNRKGAKPVAYVSIYQAMDSCSSAGKRLCTSDEWSLACAGPRHTAYPYGADYESRACITHDTITRASGSRPECRTYYGAFDMSGNLAEWTSTPSSRAPSFYNVMGGFWSSGPLSGCFDSRYSYFPQNRHNPVGFRCCRDISPVAGK